MEGSPSEEEARAIEEQLAVADSARVEDLFWLGKFFKANEQTVLEVPLPPEVHKALVDLFEPYVKSRRPPNS